MCSLVKSPKVLDSLKYIEVSKNCTLFKLVNSKYFLTKRNISIPFKNEMITFTKRDRHVQYNANYY